MLTNLLSEEFVQQNEADSIKVATIGKLTTDACLAELITDKTVQIAIQDIVVWGQEWQAIESFRLNPNCLSGGGLTGSMALEDILRDVYCVRMMQMANDLLNGAHAAAQRGNWSLALLVPLSRSLILQTTGDVNRVSLGRDTDSLAATLLPAWMALEASVVDALR